MSLNLTIGSLFSGIGGLELGLEWAGVGHTVWQVEQDEYCRAVLAKHWPDATRYEDVRNVGRANLVPVDVLCGGFPCQDVSTAGRGAGVVEGTRSGLWFEFARIIREIRPGYVVVENVTALLAGGIDAVLGELAASGYDATWDCIPASALGAHHQRDRIFVVAYAAGGGHAEELDVSVRLGRQEQAGPDARWLRAPLPDSIGIRQPRQGRPEYASYCAAHGEGKADHAFHDGGWAPEPNVGRVAHGIPARLVTPALTALGNAVVPQVAEVVGQVIVRLETERRATEAA